MFKNILILSGLFYFFSGTLFAQEKKPELILGTIMTSLPAHCATTKEMVKVFKNDQIVFTGIVDQSNVFKIYLKNDGIWTSMLDNVSGISCIYFSGMPGMLDSPKSSKKNTKVKIWE
jgi:hypothetical protein